jgi:hypothetical protein
MRADVRRLSMFDHRDRAVAVVGDVDGVGTRVHGHPRRALTEFSIRHRETPRLLIGIAASVHTPTRPVFTLNRIATAVDSAIVLGHD